MTHRFIESKKRAYPIDQKWKKFMYNRGLGNPIIKLDEGYQVK
jgi:hypothetical protein